MAFFSFGQKQDSLCLLSSAEYDAFPDSFDVSMKVLDYYQGKVFSGNVKNLNESQKALCYYFICEGMIDNSGFYSILLESLGEYNDPYSVALKLIGDKQSLKIWNELTAIFELYKTSFLTQINPPELDDESELFNEELAVKIELLEEEWYELSEERKNLFEKYLLENKSKIIKK